MFVGRVRDALGEANGNGRRVYLATADPHLVVAGLHGPAPLPVHEGELEGSSRDRQIGIS